MIPLKPEEIESWKALKVQVCMTSPTLGEVWLVPAYTPLVSERKELSIDDFAKLQPWLEAFPGAKITEFKMLTEKLKEQE